MEDDGENADEGRIFILVVVLECKGENSVDGGEVNKENEGGSSRMAGEEGSLC